MSKGLPTPRALRAAALLLAAVAGLACAGAPGPGLETDAAPLRVMTFNIRYGTAPDGENAWLRRRALLLDVIADHDPAVLGVQEAVRFQLDEIRRAMPRLGEVGVGRDDGVEAGEYSAILYDRTALTLLEGGTFWLSDTPDVPGSMTWGNRYPRVVTWARFRRAGDAGEPFLVLNTHWDHESQNAREESAAQIVAWLASEAGDRPVVVMGDFNAGEANPAFRALVEAEARGVRLRDTFRAIHPEAGTVGTYHAFTGDRTGEKIDAVLASPGWTVVDAAIVTTARDGRYPSDHFPVTATLVPPGS